jgi:hypothetical protein
VCCSFGLKDGEIAFGLPGVSLGDSVLKSICPINLIADCIAGKYRTYSGHCNNVNRPLRGAIYEPMQRFVLPNYADRLLPIRSPSYTWFLFADMSLPRIAVSGADLPNARRVSTLLFHEPTRQHHQISMTFVHWAHFIYNDMVHIGSTQAFSPNGL